MFCVVVPQVLEFLCSPDDDSRHTERQQVDHSVTIRLSTKVVHYLLNRVPFQICPRALLLSVACGLVRSCDPVEAVIGSQVLLELLQVGGVVQFDEGRLLGLAEKAEL
jgi:hypothetical protein